MKKNFENITLPASRLTQEIDNATNRRGLHKTATPEEQAERAATLTTQGHKGCKAYRINLALTTENRNFVRIMTRATGKTNSQFINAALDDYRERNGALYFALKDLFDQAAKGEIEDDE